MPSEAIQNGSAPWSQPEDGTTDAPAVVLGAGRGVCATVPTIPSFLSDQQRALVRQLAQAKGSFHGRETQPSYLTHLGVEPCHLAPIRSHGAD